MKIYKLAQITTDEDEEVEETEEVTLADQLLEENKWEYKAYGPGYWSFGDYTIDADTPLEEFEVRYKKQLLGMEENLEKAMQLASEHAQGYVSPIEEQTITPYQIIEKKFGYTDDPHQAGYIMVDGKMVNLNRPYIDHRAVTLDGSTKSMQEFIAEGNIRMDFRNGYMFVDIKKKPTNAQLKVLFSIFEQCVRGVSMNLDNGVGRYSDSRQTYNESNGFFHEQYERGDAYALRDIIAQYYGGESKGYHSPFEKFMQSEIWKLAGKTLNIGNVGSFDNENDRNRLYMVDGWLRRNDPKYLEGVSYGNDHIDLNNGRDFLKESKTYDMVILQHVYNPTDSKDLKEGIYRISPNHTSINWVKRLQATNADYIFVSGGYSEVGAWWLGSIPGYDLVDNNDYLSVYRKQGLPPITIEPPKRIKWDEVDVSWMKDLGPDFLKPTQPEDL